jgi:hypothetical protein
MPRIQLSENLDRGQYYHGRIYVGGDTLDVDSEDMHLFYGLCTTFKDEENVPEVQTPPVLPESSGVVEAVPKQDSETPNASITETDEEIIINTVGRETDVVDDNTVQDTTDPVQEANKTPKGDGTPKSGNTNAKSSQQNKRSGGK